MSIHYWMIEKSINEVAHWWIADHSESTHWDDACRWTTDSSKARHYNEKWEAEFVMGPDMAGCSATGHIDCDGPDLSADGWKTDDPQNVSEECICKGNWREIVKTYSPLIGRHYRDKSGVEYVFYGLVHGDDDYYYGMSSNEGPMLLSCVGSIEGFGFMLIRDA